MMKLLRYSMMDKFYNFPTLWIDLLGVMKRDWEYIWILDALLFPRFGFGLWTWAAWY